MRHARDQSIFDKQKSPVTCVKCKFQIYYNKWARAWLHCLTAEAHCPGMVATPHCNYDREIKDGLAKSK